MKMRRGYDPAGDYVTPTAPVEVRGNDVVLDQPPWGSTLFGRVEATPAGFRFAPNLAAAAHAGLVEAGMLDAADLRRVADELDRRTAAVTPPRLYAGLFLVSRFEAEFLARAVTGRSRSEAEFRSWAERELTDYFLSVENGGVKVLCLYAAEVGPAAVEDLTAR